MFLFQLFVPEVSGASSGYEVKARHLVPYALSDEGRKTLDERTGAFLVKLGLVKPGNILKRRSQVESHWHLPDIRDSNVTYWEYNGAKVGLVRKVEVRDNEASLILRPGIFVSESLPIMTLVREYATRMEVSLPELTSMKVRCSPDGVRFFLEQ